MASATASSVEHLSVAERVALGRKARSEVPRASHAVFEPGSHRADPIELLKRRPDIRQSERQLAAATARIGVAADAVGVGDRAHALRALHQPVAAHGFHYERLGRIGDDEAVVVEARRQVAATAALAVMFQ